MGLLNALKDVKCHTFGRGICLWSLFRWDSYGDVPPVSAFSHRKMHSWMGCRNLSNLKNQISKTDNAVS